VERWDIYGCLTGARATTTAFFVRVLLARHGESNDCDMSDTWCTVDAMGLTK
jgi:hypothetical protein